MANRKFSANQRATRSGCHKQTFHIVTMRKNYCDWILQVTWLVLTNKEVLPRNHQGQKVFWSIGPSCFAPKMQMTPIFHYIIFFISWLGKKKKLPKVHFISAEPNRMGAVWPDVETKISPIFSKSGHRRHHLKEMFFKIAQSTLNILDPTCKQNGHTRTFKNCPIWSHWMRATKSDFIISHFLRKIYFCWFVTIRNPGPDPITKFIALHI